jgi:hypothetical protein
MGNLSDSHLRSRAEILQAQITQLKQELEAASQAKKKPTKRFAVDDI